MKSPAERRSPRVRPRRAYKQEVRAEQARANTQAVLDAAVRRLRSARRIAAVTLDEIAEDAGITVRTILRQFGSKDKIMESAFIEVGRQIEASRPKTPPGNIEAALGALLHQYESQGDLNAKVVAEEHEIPLLHELLEYGRRTHRQWLTDIFSPRLKHLKPAEREQRITALYAATEVQLWKVLRRDLRQSTEQTAEIFRQLVTGVLKS